MAWSLVQSAGAQVASGTTASVAYTSNVTLGNKLIAAVAVSGNPAEDGSTPGAKTGSAPSGTMTVTSNSFSPPAGSMLIAIVSIGHGPAGTPSITVSDTGGHTWHTGPTVEGGTTTWAGIYWTYLTTAPGSITVSAADSTSVGQSVQLDVRVLNGAASSQAGAASNTGSGTSASWTGSLTTTTTGSFVYVAVAGNELATVTPNANTTTLNNYQASGGGNTSQLSGRQSASTGTGTPGATTFGWTVGTSAQYAWAALEILPSVTCTQVQDGSGNLWTQLGAVADAGNQTSLWALDVPPADTGTTPTLTATFNVSAGGSIVIEEVSGLMAGNTTAMADGTAATLTGSTQNPGSPSYTSTASNEYLVCVYGDSGTSVTTTQAAGWTLDGASRNSSANANCCVEYKNSTNGSETDGWTTSAASVWGLVEVAFKLSAGAANTFWTAAPPVYGPGLYQNPASLVAGLQPWRGDPSVTGFTTVGTGVISGTGVFAGQKDGAGTVKGITSGTGIVAPPAVPRVVNQWAGSYGQGTTFTTITSALQSCVVPLNAASSVGGGTGTATEGNWLFVLASWTQDPAIAEVHVGVGDDVREWYREYPASSAAGNVRTAIAYCPNIGTFGSNLAPQYVYVAPDGEIAAITVLVVEVANLGPWDTVGSGYPASNYAAAATSLTLSAGAPGAPSFIIAAAGGDSAAAGQAFAPSGWTTLRTVSQSNGTNQLASNVLTSAFLASSSSSQSVSASASSSTDLSGFLLAVYENGNSPVTGANTAWPTVKFEAAFGSGYNTPDSEMTWTDLSGRLWDWNETTGIQFQLAQMQASNLTLELDDNDNYLAPLNSASPYYPNVLPGTPVRIRFAMGTIGGNTVNRWYVIQRNATQWDEGISTVFRRYCEVSGTDLWAALSATPPTFYRSEVYGDAPYAWWPMDDQPGNAGLLPTTLLNAAVGNTNVLNIAVNPSKGTVQPYYDTGGKNTILGADQTGASLPANGAIVTSTGFPPGMAIYQVGTNGGWMFGDPQSSTAAIEASTGNPVSATPGSAAWQTSGEAGNTGSNGWFVYCQDNNFPVLSAGVTVEVWFKAGYYAGATGWWTAQSTGGGSSSSSFNAITAQPYNQPITVVEMATSSHPVCVVQLSAGVPGTGGALNLITYNGSTGTSHSIYTASDLRDNSWHMVTLSLTASTWQVYLDGGANANISGSGAGMTSAWTWLIGNGDLGANGGSTAGTGLVHGANIALSHIAVYPYQLPYYRILDHYWAAVSAFGQLPAPQAVQVSMSAQEYPGVVLGSNTYFVAQAQQDTFTADGSSNPLNGGYHATGGVGMSAVVAATAPGGITSGPSAWAAGSSSYSVAFVTQSSVTEHDQVDPFITWTGVAPKFNVYTGSSTASETLSAVTAGDSEAFTGGFGGSAAGNGVSHVSGGTGAAPPTAASAIGDTVGQRIERLMRNGLTTSPNRCIDPAPLLVQAPGTSGGGIQAGAAVQAIQQSDGGMLFVDNLNNLTYWQRPHLASQYGSPVWKIGPSTGKYPYYPEIKWIDDPQRVWNVITIEPLSPTGASLPEITPTDSEAAQDSQDQNGPQPYPLTSYLQSTSEMQSQANWLLSTYGTPQRRSENIKIDAAANPAMWPLVAGICVGDVVQLEDWQVGGGGNVYTMRVSSLRRHFEFGSTADQAGDVVAAVWLTLDVEPTSYWS